MLTEVADGVFVHESAWCQSNTVVVRGASGVLLIDPGIHGDEMACIVADVSELGQAVVAGFATHPHWDHMLWHPALGEAVRYGTRRTVDTARVALANGIDAKRFGIPEDAPLDLLGLLTELDAGSTEIPWDGPRVRIIEHQAHAPGHAALLIEESGVLVAGDMLSDVFMPMLDLRNAADPIEDYLTALGLLDAEAADATVVIPGHGSVGEGEEVLARVNQDRAYVQALRDGRGPVDSRIGPSAKSGWEWVADVHARQVEQLAQLGSR